MTPGRMEKPCRNCGKPFVLFICRDWRDNFCSSDCGKAHAEAKKLALLRSRTRNCKQCGGEFVVKKSQIDSGHGQYCSHQCSADAGVRAATHLPAARKKSVETWRNSLSAGKFSIKRGPDNCHWMGGALESRKRRSQKLVEYTRQYRKLNPEKVREFSQRRLGRKTGRLPNGTVESIKNLQRNRCAICCEKLDRFHVDHILPLALGGKHERGNIQILCPTCNVKKWAKHPIEYMQSLGRLL